jgi:hypothetical protein
MGFFTDKLGDLIQGTGSIISSVGSSVKHGSIRDCATSMTSKTKSAVSGARKGWKNAPKPAVLTCPTCKTAVLPSNKELKYCPKCEVVVKPESKVVEGSATDVTEEAAE